MPLEQPMAGDDRVSVLMVRFPGPMTLYPSRAKWLLIFLIGALFAAGGILMIRDGRASGWFVAGFFGIVAVIAVVVMLPGANGLVLDREGFTAKAFFREHHTRWVDTRGFGTSIVPPSHQHLVV